MIKDTFVKHPNLYVLLILVICIIAVFIQVRGFGFLVYDDDLYVTRNSHVLSGITLKGLSWAFTTNYPHFWMPLTWFTFMLDHELFGLNPGGYHLTNLLFHILSTLLLFFVLKRMTGSFWRSLFVSFCPSPSACGVRSLDSGEKGCLIDIFLDAGDVVLCALC